MITAKFLESNAVTAYGLYQWDYGQELSIDEMMIPDGTEIHFYQNELAHTDFMQNNIVRVPDLMLQRATEIKAYVYIQTETSGKTVLTIRLPIRGRPQPDNYILPDYKEYMRLLPVGGIPGQVIKKLSNKDYNIAWGNAADNIKYINNELQLMAGEIEIGDRIRINSDQQKEIELKNDGVVISWRYTDSNDWFELVKVQDLRGPAGVTPEFEIRDGHLFAKYDE